MPWPDDIKPDVRSPSSILMQEAKALAPRTRDILRAVVTVDEEKEKGKVSLHMDIVAPALGDYKQRILTARHDATMLYPVTVDADTFRRWPPDGIQGFLDNRKRENQAASDVEFATLVDRVQNSHQVKALIVSLIALSNQKLKEATEQAQKQGEAQEGPPECGPDRAAPGTGAGEGAGPESF